MSKTSYPGDRFLVLIDEEIFTVSPDDKGKLPPETKIFQEGEKVDFGVLPEDFTCFNVGLKEYAVVVAHVRMALGKSHRSGNVGFAVDLRYHIAVGYGYNVYDRIAAAEHDLTFINRG